MTSNSSQPSSPPKSEFWSTVKTLFLALFVALVLRSFLFEPFNIPSGSMIPNLLVGDFLFVSKWSYGYSKYSFPFGLDLFSGRFLEFKTPQQGEVIVFKYPKDTEFQWIKRVVGLPGDTVQMKEGILHINGEPVKLERIEDYSYIDEDDQTLHVAEQYIETFPNGTQHRILKEVPFGKARLDNTPLYEVPPGHYFVMGDNRDNSGDSRVINNLGFVPRDYVLGKASLIYFSEEHSYWPQSTLRVPMNWFSLKEWFSDRFIWWQPWKWFTSIRYSRLLKIIH
ncbi:MAG: signal peptidase I [Proteobacteria bacterium]|nr:signal peptidase I [Pseudomonadota bacterium]